MFEIFKIPGTKMLYESLRGNYGYGITWTFETNNGETRVITQEIPAAFLKDELMLERIRDDVERTITEILKSS